MEPETLSQIGGARIGAGLISFNDAWPFAKLDISDSNLTLTCLFQEWVFPKSSIKRRKNYSSRLLLQNPQFFRRFRVVRFLAQSFPQLRDGFLLPPQLRQNAAQIVMR